jgi:glucokinase
MAESWVLGIEIGGTKLQLAVGHGRGSLVALDRLRVDPARGAPGILLQIQHAFPALLAKANLQSEQVEAIGIGFGGPVDSRRGRTLKSYQVPGWDNFPLASWTSAHLGVPVVVLENDADTAGFAELRFGAGLGYSPLLYLTVGSGIGGALLIDGEIYRGFGQGATEVGHLRVPELAASGAGWRELEQVASGWGIAAAAEALAGRLLCEGRNDWVVLKKAQGLPGAITADMVAEAAAHGDPGSSAILDRARAAIAFALTQAIVLVAPRRIVMGGGVSLIGEKDWFEPIRRLIDRDVFSSFRGQFDIVPATLGEEVVVHGALALAEDAILKTPRPDRPGS